jgi:AcrR family transcriptional regulator
MCVNIHRPAVADRIEKRPYRMRRRAELEEQTRLRITEAAVELHGTLGPARTSISAIAERASVRRSTVYRHFPDEAALFAACSAHFLAANPVPDITEWEAVDDPDLRLRVALGELYARYRRTRAMLENILRDEPTMPVVASVFSRQRRYLAAAVDVLMAGRDERPEVRAAIGHAVDFSTWRSLAVEQELADDAAAGLMCRLVAAAS